MVFQFEHMPIDQGPTERADPRARPACVLKAPLRPLAGGAGATSAGTACTGTTTTSRAWCPGSATTATPESRASANLLGHRAAPAPRHAVRLPGRGARDDELPVPISAGPQGPRGRQLLTTASCRRERARHRRGAAGAGPDEPRQCPLHSRSGTPAHNAGFSTGQTMPGCGQPQPRLAERRSPNQPQPIRCSPTTRRSSGSGNPLPVLLRR